MFDCTKYIGLPFDSAKSLLEDLEYEVVEVENTGDDKHQFDTKLVVRVNEQDNKIILTTAKFLMNI